MPRLGFIGCGAIGGGIIEGLCTDESAQETYQISVYDPDTSSRAAEFATSYANVTIAKSNQDVIDGADMVFLGLGNFGPKALSATEIKTVVKGLQFSSHHVVVCETAGLLGLP